MCDRRYYIYEYHFGIIQVQSKVLSVHYFASSLNRRFKLFYNVEMLCTTFLTLYDSLKVDVTLDPATAAAWLLLSPDRKQVKTQSLIFLFTFTSSTLTGSRMYWSCLLIPLCEATRSQAAVEYFSTVVVKCMFLTYVDSIFIGSHWIALRHLQFALLLMCGVIHRSVLVARNRESICPPIPVGSIPVLPCWENKASPLEDIIG